MKSDFFLDALEGNTSQLPVRVEAIILQQCEGKAVVASGGLDLEQYQRLGLCSIKACENPRPLTTVHWGGEDCDQLYENHSLVIWEVQWQEHTFEVVHLNWETG